MSVISLAENGFSTLGQVAPCDHIVHIYEDDGVFLDTLEGFVSGGFRGGENVIIFATQPHLYALEQRIRATGRDPDALRASRQYIPFDAAGALAGFMRDGYPDDDLFAEVITSVVDKAQAGGARVRAFGEMVALLWGAENRDATLRLEDMWNTLCRDRGLSLFCAYPSSAERSQQTFSEIRALHSHVIDTQDFAADAID